MTKSVNNPVVKLYARGKESPEAVLRSLLEGPSGQNRRGRKFQTYDISKNIQLIHIFTDSKGIMRLTKTTIFYRFFAPKGTGSTTGPVMVRRPIFALICGLTTVLLSCAPLNIQSAGNSPFSQTGTLTESLEYPDFATMLKKSGCQSFRAYVWNYIYKIVSIENGNTPPYYTVKEQIIQRVQNLMKDHPAHKKDIENFALRFVEIYALVTEFMHENPGEQAEEEVQETLVQFEFGIEGQKHSAFIQKLQHTFEELDKNAKALNQNCEEEETESYDDLAERTQSGSYSDSMKEWNIDWFYTMRKHLHPLVYGARKVMATAYQSCSALDLNLMPKKHTTRGIYATSRHSSGNGWRRVISDKDALNQSHFYLSQISTPNSSQCLNTHTYPLIYDYGGKPSTSMRSINLFKNSGTGSKALGVDCSGFVASAMASAGLRLKPGVFIRPIHVKGVNSWMFKTAQKNKLSCLLQQDLSINNPIRPGDIIASNSHVLIVEMAGEDPFSLRSVRNENDCHSRTIKLSQFHFSIIQSSAHNNGVGINRMHIQDAVAGGLASISRGLKRTASRACYKMFGKETHTNIGEISILRHASNVSVCRDREIYLENQECLQSCEPEQVDI